MKTTQSIFFHYFLRRQNGQWFFLFVLHLLVLERKKKPKTPKGVCFFGFFCEGVKTASRQLALANAFRNKFPINCYGYILCRQANQVASLREQKFHAPYIQTAKRRKGKKNKQYRNHQNKCVSPSCSIPFCLIPFHGAFFFLCNCLSRRHYISPFSNELILISRCELSSVLSLSSIIFDSLHLDVFLTHMYCVVVGIYLYLSIYQHYLFSYFFFSLFSFSFCFQIARQD